MDLTFLKPFSKAGGDKTPYLLLLLFLLGLALRIFVAIVFIGDQFIWQDEMQDYYYQAWKIFQDEGWGTNTKIMPVFSILLSGIFSITQADPLMTRVFVACVNTSLIFIIYFVAKRLFDERTALFASLIITFYPILIYSSVLLLPDLFFTLLMSTGLLFFLLSEEKIRYLWIAGFFFAIATLTVSLTLPFFILSTLILTLTLKKNPRKLKWICIASYGLIFLSAPALWGVRNYFVTGHFVLTKSNLGEVLYLHNNEFASGFRRRENYKYMRETIKGVESELADKSREEQNEVFMGRFFEFVRKNPGKFLRLCLERFLNLWRFYEPTISENKNTPTDYYKIISLITYGPIFLLAIPGFIYGLRKWRGQLIVFSYIFSLIFTFSIVRSSMRARLPLEPFLAVYAAVGLNFIYESLRRRLSS